MATSFAGFRDGKARIECRLGRPRLTQTLLDHWVQGRPVLAGCALLEAALASGLTALDESRLQGKPGDRALEASACTLHSAVILAPCLLGGDVAAAALLTELDGYNGSVTVASVSASRQQHFAADVRCLASTVGSDRAGNKIDASVWRSFTAAQQLIGGAAPADPWLQPVALLDQGSAAAHRHEGYCLSPASMDACLHLGAHLAAASGGEIAVPSSVELVAGSGADCVSLAGCLVPPTAAQTSSLPDFWVSNDAHSKHMLRGLACKPLQAVKGSTPAQRLPFTIPTAPLTTVAEAEQGNRHVLYSTTWQAAGLEPGELLPASQPAHIVATLTGREPVPFALAERNLPVSTAGAILASLQALMSRRALSSATAVTRLGMFDAQCAPVGRSARSTPDLAAMLWGFGRAAASEGAQARWGLADVAGQTSGVPAGLSAADASGTLVRGGSLQLKPMLTAQPRHLLEGNSVGTASQAAVSVITGGLGGGAGVRQDVVKTCWGSPFACSLSCLLYYLPCFGRIFLADCVPSWQSNLCSSLTKFSIILRRHRPASGELARPSRRSAAAPGTIGACIWRTGAVRSQPEHPGGRCRQWGSAQHRCAGGPSPRRGRPERLPRCRGFAGRAHCSTEIPRQFPGRLGSKGGVCRGLRCGLPGSPHERVLLLLHRRLPREPRTGRVCRRQLDAGPLRLAVPAARAARSERAVGRLERGGHGTRLCVRGRRRPGGGSRRHFAGTRPANAGAVAQLHGRLPHCQPLQLWTSDKGPAKGARHL